MATRESLDLGLNGDDISMTINVSVKLHGAHVGVWIDPDDDDLCGDQSLTIWNWCTGEQEMVSRFLL